MRWSPPPNHLSPDTPISVPGLIIGHIPDPLFRGPPGLKAVVEVVSSRPEDERRDRLAKPQDYAALGASHYWIVDPWLRSIEIFTLDEHRRYVRVVAAIGGEIDPVPGLPELKVDVDAMWAEIDRPAE